MYKGKEGCPVPHGNINTLLIITLAAFQLRSFGIFLVLFASSIITAPVTAITAVGGLENDFISVKLFWKKSINTLSIRKKVTAE